MAESEWGKINAGQRYGLLAVDLDRAFACAGLRQYEAIVVQAVREASWGTSARRKVKGDPWPDAEPCRLDFVAMAKGLDVPHQRLYEALSRLVKSRILIRDEDDRLSINKDVERWRDPVTCGPRLSRAQLAYAMAARTRKGAKATESSPAEGCTPKRSSKPSHERENVQGVHGLECKPCTPKREDHSRIGVHRPNKDRVRGDSPRGEEKKTSSEATADQASPGGAEPEWASDPRFEAVVDECLVRSVEDDAEVRRRLGTLVKAFGLPAVEKATRAAIIHGAGDVIAYAAKALENMAAEGKLPKEPPPKPRPLTRDELMARIRPPQEWKLDPTIWSREALMKWGEGASA